MPVLLPLNAPAGEADKAMTLDLAGLRAENAAATPTPTAAQAATEPGATDFSEPSSSSVAPPAPSRTAVDPPVPSELAQTFPRPAPTTMETKAGVAAPSGAAGAPGPKQQCFTNTEGTKICYLYDQQAHNTTDVHKEGGVNDFHNQAGGSEREGVQGHIPGNNITGTLNDLGKNPPANEQKDGNTVFQGKAAAEVNHQHDIHKDNSTFTDHQVDTGDGDFDWKSAYKGPDGSKEMAEVNKDGQFKSEEDTRVDAEGKNKAETEQFTGSDDHRFVSDNPGTKDDSSLTWDEDWVSKSQKEEFTGKGVYDLHEESSSAHKVQAKVDGEQGWKDFEQDMQDFDDVFFDEDAAWKEKMKDPRYKATATLSAAQVAGTAESGILERRQWKEFKHQHDMIQEEKKHPSHSSGGIYSLPPFPHGDESTLPDRRDESAALEPRQWEEFKHQHDMIQEEKKHPSHSSGGIYSLPPFPHGDESTLPDLLAIRDIALDVPEGSATAEDGAQEVKPNAVKPYEAALAVLLGLVIGTLIGLLIIRCLARCCRSRAETRERQRDMAQVGGFQRFDTERSEV